MTIKQMAIIKWTGMLGLFACLTLLSCNAKQESGAEENSNVDSDIITISQAQFDVAGMEIGTPTMETFHDFVSCRGYLTAPSDGKAIVSTQVAGVVKDIRFKLGDRVRKGQTLFTVSGNEFLSLQQQFAEAAAQYQKAVADYERMKALQTENIGAKKDYISAESVYKSSLASYNAFKTRIESLNISPARIENGEMYSAFPVVAPISGYITTSNAVLGQYVDMFTGITEIVDVDKLQLELSVFDEDINKLDEGQLVYFYLTSNPEKVMTAILTTIGRSINPETKSIECIASIKDEDKEILVSSSFVESNIAVSDKEALSVPATALQRSDSEYFVYVLESQKDGEYSLRRTNVEIGSTNENLTEIISDNISQDTKVITKGVATL